MKKLHNLLSALFIISLTIASCDDWTEPEILTINKPTIEEQNPELYASYLAYLRKYRETEHQKVYAWFDNSVKERFSRAHYLTDIPDSIDVVGLIYPDRLTQNELNEIAEIRNKKGIKVIYSIDFDKIKEAYNEKRMNAPEEEPLSESFRDFLTDSLSNALTLLRKYKYDGISLNYVGKSPLYMNSVEKKEYMENENCFIGIINDWSERNTDIPLIYQGRPENLIDRTILNKCDIIFINSTQATSLSDLTRLYTLGYFAEYANKYGMCVMGTPLVGSSKYSTFTDERPSVIALGEWALIPHNENPIAAVGVYDFSGDYFSADKNYKNIRNLISTLTPSIK